MKKAFAFHPPLYAVYPVLLLYSANMGLIPVGDILRPCLMLLVATFAVWGITGLLMRNAERGAAVASLASLEFFTFGRVWATHESWGFLAFLQDQGNFLYAWAFICVATLIAIGWAWRGYATVTKFLNYGAVALSALVVGSIILSGISIRRDLARVAPQKAFTRAGQNTGATLPDVYYVVLDGYGRADALKKFFNFDNGAFVRQLEARGFYVALQSHSNYVQTELSLASSLNMDYVSNLVPSMEKASHDRAVLDKLIDVNAFSLALKSKGYLYLAVTSGFPGVNPRSADVVLRETRGYTMLESSLLEETPLRQGTQSLVSQYAVRRAQLKAAFQYLSTLGPGGARPRFVFAHILAPHPPFVLGPKGEDVSPGHVPYGFWDGSHYFEVGGTQAMYAKGYTGQLQWVNQRVLETVDAIVKSSKTQPIIILQGDHGSRAHLNHNALSKSDVTESFRNLNAYLVPASARQHLYPGITPINSFRVVLNAVFGHTLPLLPDRSFYTTWDRPYDPVDVTAHVEGP
jgi:hypothetical protein